MSEGKDKTIDPGLAERVTPELSEAVAAAAKDGKVACARLRKLAEDHGVVYKVAGAAADMQGIRVRDCDLGCF